MHANFYWFIFIKELSSRKCLVIIRLIYTMKTVIFRILFSGQRKLTSALPFFFFFFVGSPPRKGNLSGIVLGALEDPVGILNAVP